MIAALAFAASLSPLAVPLFALVDHNGDNAVTDAELCAVREELGAPLERKAARAAIGRRADLARFDAWVGTNLGPPDEADHFARLDDDGDGRVGAGDVGRIVAVVAHELGDDDLDRLVAMYDADGDAMLSLEEFSRMSGEASLRSTYLPEALAVPIANAFDPDANGVADAGELATVAIALGVDQPDGRAYVKQWDANGDRHVTIDEVPLRPGSALPE